jgi:hypothetical protein
VNVDLLIKWSPVISLVIPILFYITHHYQLFNNKFKDNKKTKSEFKKLISNHVYNTFKFCHYPYFTGSRMVVTKHTASRKNIKNIKWDNTYKKLQKEYDKINEFYLFNINILRNSNNIDYNIVSYCIILRNGKYNYSLLEQEKFDLKFKKEIDFIKKNNKNYRK